MSKWHPIESAPRDGTRVLLNCDRGPDPQAWRSLIGRYFNLAWVESNSETNYGSPVPYRITHWKPLSPAEEED